MRKVIGMQQQAWRPVNLAKRGREASRRTSPRKVTVERIGFPDGIDFVENVTERLLEDVGRIIAPFSHVSLQEVHKHAHSLQRT